MPHLQKLRLCLKSKNLESWTGNKDRCIFLQLPYSLVLIPDTHNLDVRLFTELAAKCCNEAEKWYFFILGSPAMLSISDITVSFYCPPMATARTFPAPEKHWTSCPMMDTQTVYMSLDLILFWCKAPPFVMRLCFPQILRRKPLFHHCLVACSLVITIYMNRLPCHFLMLLQILDLSPYYFWRVCV